MSRGQINMNELQANHHSSWQQGNNNHHQQESEPQAITMGAPNHIQTYISHST
jgi:imidazoleglycerol phosphate dehydratase HisB